MEDRETALEAERRLREALERSDGSRSALAVEGDRIAAMLVDLGESLRAAQLLADLGRIERAVELFLSVDAFAFAAELIGNGGDHLRAAHLFEAAGHLDRAVDQWFLWSTTADDPLRALEDVGRLGGSAAAFEYLRAVGTSHQPTPENADLFLRLASACQPFGHPELVIELLERVAAGTAPYEQARAWLARLQREGVALATRDIELATEDALHVALPPPLPESVLSRSSARGSSAWDLTSGDYDQLAALETCQARGGKLNRGW